MRESCKKGTMKGKKTASTSFVRSRMTRTWWIVEKTQLKPATYARGLPMHELDLDVSANGNCLKRTENKSKTSPESYAWPKSKLKTTQFEEQSKRRVSVENSPRAVSPRPENIPDPE